MNCIKMNFDRIFFVVCQMNLIKIHYHTIKKSTYTVLNNKYKLHHTGFTCFLVFIGTVCPRSFIHFYVATYFLLEKTSLTYSMIFSLALNNSLFRFWEESFRFPGTLATARKMKVRVVVYHVPR